MPACPRALVLSVCVAFAACHSEHASLPSPSSLAAAPIAIVPVVHRRLDEPVLVLFDAPLDPTSCTPATVQIGALEGLGVGSTPNGTLHVTALGDGTFADAVVRFVPSLRTLAVDGASPDGLFPDTLYAVRLPANGLRSANGVPLASYSEFRFRTAAGTSRAELYSNGRAGGPRVASTDYAPRVDGDRWSIGTVIDTPSVVRVRFDQPIDPSQWPLPYDSTQDEPGFASLVYDDPVRGYSRVIDAIVELVANDVDGCELALRPQGLLPNAANVRLALRGELRDAIGESTFFADSAAATMRTEDALRPRGEFVKSDFADIGSGDFSEPLATVQGERLHAAEAFPVDEVGGVVGDWSPTVDFVRLDTREQRLVFEDGRERTFTGGVFRVRNLRIPEGSRVLGRGPNPLVFLVEGDAIVEGEISVRGGNGGYWSPSYRGPGDVTPNDQPSSVGVPTGGRACCGGGNGADNSQNILRAPPSDGLPGLGPDGNASGGGGGLLAVGECNVPSGGGGGAFATQGDPGFPVVRPPGLTLFVQREGFGGFGCRGQSASNLPPLPGGAPGELAFFDGRRDNDFYGDLYDPRRGLRVRGELNALRGGSGGGSGGDIYYRSTGGGGGAGGGVLVLQARGRVVVGANGRLDANGGDGYATIYPQIFSGGGGGAGGMIVVMAGERIVLNVHGGTLREHDTDFCIQADGGVSRSGVTDPITDKYAFTSANEYDSVARGGFGGLGLVQLMAPMGTNNADLTNTVLDDAIDVVQNGIVLQGSQKMRYLAWRGLGTENGTFVDDYGNPTGFAWGEGDIRPSPVLLPVPYGPRSRARSEWIALGAADRRPLAQHDGQARAVVVENGVPTGPDFAHATSGDGWLEYSIQGDRARFEGSYVDGVSARIAAFEGTTWRGALALQLRLETLALGTNPGRWSGYEAELTAAAGAPAVRARVLWHEGHSVWLERPDFVDPGLATLRLRNGLTRASHVEVPARMGASGAIQPTANVRIGVAFHRNPAHALRTGPDPDRLPVATQDFLYDLGDPSVQQQIRAFGARAVQWDVTFDRRWQLSPFDPTPALDGAFAIDGLWLPFRF